MDGLTAEETSANKILYFLEYFASKGFREFEIATSADTRPEHVIERRSREISNRDDLATVARKMVSYLTHFPSELRRTLTVISEG
jgi:hypothetical protein